MATNNSSNFPVLDSDGDTFHGYTGYVTQPTAGPFLAGTKISVTNGTQSTTISLDPAPGLTLLGGVSNNASDSDVATLDLENLIDDTYDQYVIQIKGMTPASNNVDLHMLFGTGATPTWQNSAYKWMGASDISASVEEQASQTEIIMNVESGTTHQLDSSTDGRYAAWVVLNNARNASQYTSMCWKHFFLDENSVPRSGVGAAFWESTTAITSLRLLMSSGNVDYGSMYLYGVIKYV